MYNISSFSPSQGCHSYSIYDATVGSSMGAVAAKMTANMSLEVSSVVPSDSQVRLAVPLPETDGASHSIKLWYEVSEESESGLDWVSVLRFDVEHGGFRKLEKLDSSHTRYSGYQEFLAESADDLLCIVFQLKGKSKGLVVERLQISVGDVNGTAPVTDVLGVLAEQILAGEKDGLTAALKKEIKVFSKKHPNMARLLFAPSIVEKMSISMQKQCLLALAGEEPFKVKSNPLFSFERAVELEFLSAGSSSHNVEKFLSSELVDTDLAPSPFISISWLRAQGVKFNSLNELCAVKFDGRVYVSPHPFIKKIKSIKGETLFDLIDRIFLSEGLCEQTIFPISEYKLHHKDIKSLSDKNALRHFLEIGIFQNRLKFCINSVSVKRPKSYQVSKHLDEIKRMAIKDVCLVNGSSGIVELPAHTVKPCPSFITEVVNNDYSELSNGNIDMFWVKVFDHLEDVNLEQVVYVMNQSDSLNGSMTDVAFIASDLSRSVDRVLYCVNIGGYDSPPDLGISGDFDGYTKILITDSVVSKDYKDWTVLRPTIRFRDVKRTCLWYKTHPHILFPNADHVVWIDSNIDFHAGAFDLLKAHEAISEIATFRHPDRDCVYKEAEAIKSLRLDRHQAVDIALNNFEKYSMPRNFGLYETNVLYSKARDLQVRSFFNLWWKFIFFGSRRDQLSFTLAAKVSAINISNLDGFESAKTSRVISKRKHVGSTGRFL
ncbi:MAG: glycosyltransferase domain-containing protein [Maricaulaceae bacterium]